MKSGLHDLPSVHLAYAAALASRAGHDVVGSTGELVDGDTAVVVSSLVDYRRETAWARAMRERGVRVGFIGLAAHKLPHLSGIRGFFVDGEPGAALHRLFAGERRRMAQTLRSTVSTPCRFRSGPLGRAPPFDFLSGGRMAGIVTRVGLARSGSARTARRFSADRTRSVASILDELSYLQETRGPVHVVFRDPLFSQERERTLELCDGIRSRQLGHTFECETRLDRLDDELLQAMRDAGLRAMTFGVESVAPTTLKKVGRRPIPEPHQRHNRVVGTVASG